MTRFSWSDITRVLRSGPASTRSMAASIAAMVTSQPGGVEDVGPVGGGDEDDAGARVETIHLNEQLVERLLALVVAAAQAGAAVAADGVDLVDEYDGGRRLLCLLEQVAHAARSHAHEHLDEVRARDREERGPGLARHRPGQQCLAGAR